MHVELGHTRPDHHVELYWPCAGCTRELHYLGEPDGATECRSCGKHYVVKSGEVSGDTQRGSGW